MPVTAATTALSVGSSLIGGNSAKQAAKGAQALAHQGAVDSNKVATDNYAQAGTNLNPYITQGGNAQNALAGLLGTGGDSAASNAAFNNYLNSTNYQFQLNQGLNGVKTANAPAFQSGATAKALNDYAQGQAGSALSGYEGLLQGLGNTGAGAASNLGSLGSQEANQFSDNTFAGINGQVAGMNKNANANNQEIGGITQGLSSYQGATANNPMGNGTSFLTSAAHLFGF